MKPCFNLAIISIYTIQSVISEKFVKNPGTKCSPGKTKDFPVHSKLQCAKICANEGCFGFLHESNKCQIVSEITSTSGTSFFAKSKYNGPKSSVSIQSNTDQHL